MAELQHWRLEQKQREREWRTAVGRTGSSGRRKKPKRPLRESTILLRNPTWRGDDKLPSRGRTGAVLLRRAGFYVGSGLISFPFEDHETGKIKTMFMVQPGDDVKISTVKAGTPDAAHFNATVVDVFKSGMSEYDSTSCSATSNNCRKFAGMIDPDDRRAGDHDRSRSSSRTIDRRRQGRRAVAGRVSAAGLYSVRTWEQKQGAAAGGRRGRIGHSQRAVVSDHRGCRLRHSGDLLT